MARQKGLEPLTYCLEGSCSIQLSYWRIFGAGDGNRTRVSSLEGWCSPIELHPQVLCPLGIQLEDFNTSFLFCQYPISDKLLFTMMNNALPPAFMRGVPRRGGGEQIVAYPNSPSHNCLKSAIMTHSLLSACHWQAIIKIASLPS